jgi:hypothetical protein
VASVDVLGPDGSIETITGTTIHPVWSVDREDWVPLGELVQGETLQGEIGLAVVLSITLSRVAQPVYNLEVHGEHVYQVGELGVLVHNATSDDCLKLVAPKGGKWKEIARRDGPALDQQAAFSGKQIRYRNGKAYIEEFELDGVNFDRFRNGILGEVKDDFGFAARVGKYNPNLKAITEVTDEARRQIAVAKKHGLKLEWYVRKQDLQFFENALGDLLDDITQIVY